MCKVFAFVHVLFAQWIWGSPFFFPTNREFTELDGVYTPNDQYLIGHRIAKSPWFFTFVIFAFGFLGLKLTVWNTLMMFFKKDKGKSKLNLNNRFTFDQAKA